VREPQIESADQHNDQCDVEEGPRARNDGGPGLSAHAVDRPGRHGVMGWRWRDEASKHGAASRKVRVTMTKKLICINLFVSIGLFKKDGRSAPMFRIHEHPAIVHEEVDFSLFQQGHCSLQV